MDANQVPKPMAHTPPVNSSWLVLRWIIVIAGVVALSLIYSQNVFSVSSACSLEGAIVNCTNPLVGTNGYVRLTLSNPSYYYYYSDAGRNIGIACSQSNSSVPTLNEFTIIGIPAGSAENITLQCYKASGAAIGQLQPGKHFVANLYVNYSNGYYYPYSVQSNFEVLGNISARVSNATVQPLPAPPTVTTTSTTIWNYYTTLPTTTIPQNLTLTLSPSYLVMYPGSANSSIAVTNIDEIGWQGPPAGIKISTGQAAQNGQIWVWPLNISVPANASRGTYRLVFYTSTVGKTPVYQYLTVNVMVNPTSSSANYTSCSNFILSGPSYNSSIKGICVWGGGKMNLFFAVGNSGYVQYNVRQLGALNVSFGGGAGCMTPGNGCSSAGYNCLDSFGSLNNNMPSGNYLVSMQTGKGGGGCGNAVVEIVPSNSP